MNALSTLVAICNLLKVLFHFFHFHFWCFSANSLELFYSQALFPVIIYAQNIQLEIPDVCEKSLSIHKRKKKRSLQLAISEVKKNMKLRYKKTKLFIRFYKFG